jgi:small GTP-binding protein
MTSRGPPSAADKTDGNDVTYKVLLLGDTGVGKTSLIRALTGRPFSHSLLSTVGVDFVKQSFDIDGAKVCLQIWDTAGQERFRSITRFQYRGTKGLLLVYDITNRNSFEMLDYWLESIRQEVDHSNKDPVPVIIVGNKCDLEFRRAVTHDEGEQVRQKDFQTAFFETSAATGANVRECFEKLAHAITDLNNPIVMRTYRLSAAIDKAKNGVETVTDGPDGGSSSLAGRQLTAPATSKSPSTTSTGKSTTSPTDRIKLNGKRPKKSQCSCST